MSNNKNNAPAVGAARARDTTTGLTSTFCHTSDFAQVGEKALAVSLYNIGARSLEETQRAFNRHPEWLEL